MRSRTELASVLAAAMLLVLEACFSPSFNEGLACSEAQTCPPGQQCYQGVCYSQPPDALFCSDSGPRCQASTSFTQVTPLGNLGDGGKGYPFVTRDGLTLYFTVNHEEIRMAARSSLDEAFGSPTQVALSGVTSPESFSLTDDGLVAYLSGSDPAVPDHTTIFRVRRATIADAWSAAEPLPELLHDPSPGGDENFQPFISADGTRIVFNSTRDMPGYHLFEAVLDPSSAKFGAARELVELASSGDNQTPSLSHDTLTIYFSSNRAGGAGAYDLYRATRPTPDALFGAPESVGGLNTTASDVTPFSSADGCTFYLARGVTGDDDQLYAAELPPLCH